MTPCKPLASYGQWSTWVRQPLVKVGMADPAQQNTGPSAARMEGHIWYRPDMIREAVNRAKTYAFGPITNVQAEMKDLMRKIAEDCGEINRRRLGKWIARHQGRIVDGLRFEKASGTTSEEKWITKSATSVLTVLDERGAESVDRIGVN